MVDIKKLLDEHEVYIRGVSRGIKSVFSPMIIFEKNGKRTANVVIGSREEIRLFIDLMVKTRPEWIVVMTEAFMKIVKKDEEIPKDYQYGCLEKEFNNGTKNVIEAYIIQVYTRSEKMMRVIRKDNLKRFGKDVDVFDGYLAINDVERVFNIGG